MSRSLKHQIKKVLKEQYGSWLWALRDDVSYAKGIAPFVDALCRVLQGEIGSAEDLEYDLAKYGRGGLIDAEIGKRFKTLRLRKDLSLEELVKRTGLSLSYIEAIERGDLSLFPDEVIALLRSIEATEEERGFVFDGPPITLERRIQDVIKLYYGKSLWSLRPQVEYEQAIEPLVRSLVALVEPLPGYKTEIIDGRRQAVIDPDTASKVVQTFQERAEVQ